MSDQKKKGHGKFHRRRVAGDCESSKHFDPEWMKRKVFVGNISYRMNEKDLRQHFSNFGDVSNCHVARDHILKWSRGIGFVTFKTEESALKALAANEEQLYLDDRQMRVKPAELSKRVTYFESERLEVDDEDEVSFMTTDLDKNLERTSDHTCRESGLYLNDLYDELLVQIFSYLPLMNRVRIERVCRRWQGIALLIWAKEHHLEFKGVFRRFHALTDKILNSLLQKCGTALQSLDLSASPRLLTDFAGDVIGKHCSNLERLNMSGVSATNISIQRMAAKCSKLKVIELQRCFHLGEKGFWWLFHSCRELEHINIQGSTSLTGQCFHMLGPNMRKVVVNDCLKLRDVGIEKIQAKCDQVEEIQISNCRKLTDSSMNLIKNMKNLRVLHLSGNFPDMSSTGLKCIGMLQRLKELDVSFNALVDDGVLCCVAGGCVSLQCVNITGCHLRVTDTGLQSLAHCCQLNTLNISYLDKITDRSVELIAIQGRLKKLIVRACPELTDSGVISVAELCPNLTLLDLSGCLKITNASLESLISVHTQDKDDNLVLNIGGTSMVPEEVDLSSAKITVDLHDFSFTHLRPDREIILPDDDEFSSEEDGVENAGMKNTGDEWEVRGEEEALDRAVAVRLHPGCPAGAEVLADDEWDQFEDAEDGFLISDDPLEAERWNMS